MLKFRSPSRRFNFYNSIEQPSCSMHLVVLFWLPFHIGRIPLIKYILVCPNLLAPLSILQRFNGVHSISSSWSTGYLAYEPTLMSKGIGGSCGSTINIPIRATLKCSGTQGTHKISHHTHLRTLNRSRTSNRKNMDQPIRQTSARFNTFWPEISAL